MGVSAEGEEFKELRGHNVGRIFEGQRGKIILSVESMY